MDDENPEKGTLFPLHKKALISMNELTYSTKLLRCSNIHTNKQIVVTHRTASNSH